MMTAMLVACPSFSAKWQEFRDEWIGDPILTENGGDGSLPTYLALSELADHLIEKLEQGETSQFPAIFDVVERWIAQGSDYVSEAAVVGLLEDLLMNKRYRKCSPKHFEPWLKPLSAKWAVEIVDFWDRLSKDKFRPLSID